MDSKYIVERNAKATERMLRAATALADEFGMEPPTFTVEVRSSGRETKAMLERELISRFMEALAANVIGESYVGYDEALASSNLQVAPSPITIPPPRQDPDPQAFVGVRLVYSDEVVPGTVEEKEDGPDMGEQAGGFSFLGSSLPAPAVTGPEQPKG